MQRLVEGLCRARCLDDFLDALVETANKLVIGDPRRQDVFMGPVINEAAMDRFTTAAKTQSTPGRSSLGGQQLAGGLFDRGPYVPPTIVTGLPATTG